jgi:hypothetical protein
MRSGILKMTKAELEATKKALEATRKAATKSKAAARAYLVKLGVVTKKGKLTKRYNSAA